ALLRTVTSALEFVISLIGLAQPGRVTTQVCSTPSRCRESSSRSSSVDSPQPSAAAGDPSALATVAYRIAAAGTGAVHLVITHCSSGRTNNTDRHDVHFQRYQHDSFAPHVSSG